MDILNEIAEQHYNDLDDLLAFISIYDDENRISGYQKMMSVNRLEIRRAVCLEIGCGFGVFAEHLARLGARKVYAVEKNPYLFQIARDRLAAFSNVQVIYEDILNFKAPEKIDIVIHELFGQLLFDEDLYVLDRLSFVPSFFLPDRAELLVGAVNSKEYVDTTVTPAVLQNLEGCLVSGLFDADGLEPVKHVMGWSPGKNSYSTQCNVSALKGDLLFMGIKIYYRNKPICRTGVCDNWSFVWTPRAGDVFNLEFKPAERGTEVIFKWVE
ncbi:methyltransferase domain-containing protein [candidate division KSB1 bacterium]|nr:methyltransferase domain-containing protein [candidate division KSB1 bacterium]